MRAGSVVELWRYPAKSMQGERIQEATCTTAGLVGDRWWAVRDEVRGGVRGAKKIGSLMQLAARYVDTPSNPESPPPIEISLPGGGSVRSDDADVDARLSAALDHPVTLWPLRPPDDLEHYRRGRPDSDDLLTELQAIFGRQPEEPLPDLSTFPPVILEYESPPGTYVDAYPLHLVTDRSLASLAELTPTSEVDVRRFRPNLVVSVGPEGPPFPEQEWLGRRVRVGDAVLDVVSPCPRCVMVTRPFADLGRDTALLRTIVRRLDQNVGVYANVVSPGEVVAGAPVEVVG